MWKFRKHGHWQRAAAGFAALNTAALRSHDISETALVISVLCGTIGLYEVRVRPNDDEFHSFEAEGSVFLDGIRLADHVWRGGWERQRMPAWHRADLISFAVAG
jgi:hypothetical protein